MAIAPLIPISAKLFCKHSQVAFMPYGVVLKSAYAPSPRPLQPEAERGLGITFQGQS